MKATVKQVKTNKNNTTPSNIGRRVKVTNAKNKSFSKRGIVREETKNRFRVKFETGGWEWIAPTECTFVRGRRPGTKNSPKVTILNATKKNPAVKAPTKAVTKTTVKKATPKSTLVR